MQTLQKPVPTECPHCTDVGWVKPETLGTPTQCFNCNAWYLAIQTLPVLPTVRKRMPEIERTIKRAEDDGRFNMLFALAGLGFIYLATGVAIWLLLI